MIKFVTDLLEDESGAELVEYGIGASVLAAIAVVGYALSNQVLADFFTEVGVEIGESTSVIQNN